MNEEHTSTALLDEHQGAKEEQTASGQEKQLIAFSSMFKESFSASVARPTLSVWLLISLAGTIFIGMLIWFGLLSISLFLGETVGIVYMVIVSILAYLLVVLGFMLTSIAVLRIALKEEQHFSFWNSVWWGAKNIWAILIIALYVQLATTTAYLLLIIPGIILALYTAYSLFAFIDEDQRGFDALLRSIDIVRGNFWGLFWRTICFSLLSLLAMVVPFAIIIAIVFALAPKIAAVLSSVFVVAGYPFLIVWIAFGFALLFKSAQARKPYAQFNLEKYARLRKVLIAAAILGVPAILALNVFSIQAEMKEYQEGSEFSVQNSVFTDE